MIEQTRRPPHTRETRGKIVIGDGSRIGVGTQMQLRSWWVPRRSPHPGIDYTATERNIFDRRRDILFALLPNQPVKPTRYVGVLSCADPEVLRRLEWRRH
jgi:hypothetical protein